jgi:tetratricopeptide (TPR) repeat protein
VNALVAQAIQLDRHHPDIARLQESRRRDRRASPVREAEQRIRELRQRIGTLIARANATARHDDAIALLSEALGLDPEHTEVKELLEARHKAKAEAEAAEQRARELAAAKERAEREAEEARRKAEERRRQGIDAQLAEASRHLALGNTTKAIVITEAILGIEPDHPAAKAKRADIERAVEAKQEAERPPRRNASVAGRSKT